MFVIYSHTKVEKLRKYKFIFKYTLADIWIESTNFFKIMLKIFVVFDQFVLYFPMMCSFFLPKYIIVLSKKT